MIKERYLLYICVLISWCTSLFSCTDIDLRNSALGPPRNQGSMYWCSSFAAADMLSYKIGKRISALDVAIQYYDQFGYKYNEKGSEIKLYEQSYGDTPINVMAALEKGLCLEKDLPSDDYSNIELYDLLKKIDSFYTQYNDIENISCSGDIEADLNKIFPELQFEEFIKIVENVQSTSFFNELADASCKRRFKPKRKYKTKLFEREDTKPEKLLDIINKQLSKKNIMSIGYDGRMLTGDEKIWAHDSTIVGRRFNETTKQCEYLIRNSYGSGCGGYNARFDCDKGNIYVPEAEIKKWILDIAYLQ